MILVLNADTGDIEMGFQSGPSIGWERGGTLHGFHAPIKFHRNPRANFPRSLQRPYSKSTVSGFSRMGTVHLERANVGTGVWRAR
jgi:hypothetical protein